MPVGVWHALGNGGREAVRWLSVNTPQRLPATAVGRTRSSHPSPFDLAALDAAAQRPPFGDPRLR